jgi:hypothetical protein
MTPAGMYFDQTSGLNLPVGVELATIGRRIGAFFLSFPLFIVTLGIGYAIWGLVVWGQGQTPALQVLGMRRIDRPDHMGGLFRPHGERPGAQESARSHRRHSRPA